MSHDLQKRGGELDQHAGAPQSGPSGDLIIWTNFGHHPRHTSLVLGCRDLGNSSGAASHGVCHQGRMTALS